MTLLLQYWLVSSGDLFFAAYFRELPIGGLWVVANKWMALLIFLRISRPFVALIFSCVVIIGIIDENDLKVLVSRNWKCF
ncbi:uncharacterized protein EV420DRAFT_1522590 [Desarmillaria tabescens]|uniref:Uncharacterized protein n=1 Tax=Armillaria tabescens TaxID=1929756 RepID=A0AA39NCG6_ARMTA|nr:uncharacterized protein EV420DRAFT_1522590 [Desarmillaria tabescens]KAK0463059.1 hypothetical protein EV420DRAFT_1522590 [Desarmillaria tabescens]